MKSSVEANWWHYDIATRTLFYEIVEKNRTNLKKLRCTISAGETENSWVAIPVPQLEAKKQSVILWEDNEFSPGKELVESVRNWEIHSNSRVVSFGIYYMFVNQLIWEWEKGIPEIRLRGHYRDGTFFEDTLRLIIPFANGSALAISKSKNRKYFLQQRKTTIAEKPKKNHGPRRRKVSKVYEK